MTPQAAYDALKKDAFELGILRSTGALLAWDEQTHLPEKGTPYRAEQMAYFGKVVHEQFTRPQVGEWIATLEQSELVSDPDSDVAANTRELRRAYDRATKVPASLVEAMAKHDVLSQQAWVDARKKADFKPFASWLKQTYDYKREEAECVGYKAHVYDALLDAYEPYATTADVKVVLENLRDRLVPIVQRVAGSSKKAPQIAGPFPVEAQERFGRLAAEQIGFDFTSGRLDVSVHPFCSGMAPGDTRMTTRYREDEMDGAFFGVLHETGHGLYEQGLPKTQHPGMPLADAISLGIHESQSRMWENLVGRSSAFWKHFAPIARQHFDAFKSVDEPTLIFAFNDVRPTFIRTESDEVTYNLHILLRFEMETALLERRLDVNDVPEAWNQKMNSYLGITPPDAAKGCLQDVHWSCGLVGYFPTYSLGNLYAAQFFEQARADLGDLDAMFARGEFRPLLDWLRKNIHQHGRRYTASQLVERVTNKPLSADALIRHLNAKVDAFYG
jgi:carboxypeptidase Taq